MPTDVDSTTAVAEGDGGGGPAVEAAIKPDDEGVQTRIGRDEHGRSLRISKESENDGEGGNGGDESRMLHSPPKTNRRGKRAKQGSTPIRDLGVAAMREATGAEDGTLGDGEGVGDFKKEMEKATEAMKLALDSDEEKDGKGKESDARTSTDEGEDEARRGKGGGDKEAGGGEEKNESTGEKTPR